MKGPFLPGETANRIKALIAGNAISAGKNVTVDSVTPDGTFLSAAVAAGGGPTCDCEDGAEVWSVDYDGQSSCRDEVTIIELDPCATSWTYYFNPNSTGDRFSVNGEELGGCPTFDPTIAEGTISTEDSGFELIIEIEGCCGQGTRNSSYEGYIIQNCE